MNKKLMAMAVAGALATPMAALAQTSTVQIYGLINAEYGFVDNPDTTAGAGRSNTDTINSGASRIGFKGEERLGGGLSAWFQCESSLEFLGGGGPTSGNWCDRNSALGLKGGFGNVYIGTWDAPMKRVSGVTRITNETGWTGTQTMTLSNGGAWNGTFSRRNAHTVNYDTPNWGGFSASGQYTTLQAIRGLGGTNAGIDAGTPPGNVSPTPKGRAWSVSAQYTGGPFYIGAAYTRSDDDKSAGRRDNGNDGGRDDAWLIGATYTFGPVKVGLTYIDAQIDCVRTTATGAGSCGTGANPGGWPGTGFTQNQERKSWNLAADWNIAGPHTLRAGYANAGDIDRDGAATANDGAKLYQIGYIYSLSKRTQVGVAYARQDNDSAGTYSLTGGGGGAGVRAGDTQSVINFQMVHTF